MSIFVVIAIAIAIVLVLLRMKKPIGIAILASGLFIWVCTGPQIEELTRAFYQMITRPMSYDLVGALYLVVCLEIQLRKSGALAGMVKALYRMFASPKITLAAMPAFLGLLPSIGGARFSAPVVDEISKGFDINGEQKAAVNFWFRHIFEFSSPLIPGMLLGCAITGIPIGELIVHLGWLTVVAFVAGWFVIIRPMQVQKLEKGTESEEDVKKHNMDFVLSLAPVIANVVLMVAFGLHAAVSMFIVVLAMVGVLRFFNRPVSIRDTFVGAMDVKLFANVLSILLFIQILDTTGLLAQLVAAFDHSPLPVPVVIAIISFIVGMLTGLSQGHVAIVMPIVAALSMGDVTLAGIALVFGVSGQMITPTHVCLTVTLDYFKCDFFKTLVPVVIAQVIVMAIFSAWTWYSYIA